MGINTCSCSVGGAEWRRRDLAGVRVNIALVYRFNFSILFIKYWRNLGLLQRCRKLTFRTKIGKLTNARIQVRLRRGCAVARLLGLQVRIPPAGMDVCILWKFCVVRGFCDGPIPRPEESYRLWRVILWDLETSRKRRPWPALGCCARKKK